MYTIILHWHLDSPSTWHYDNTHPGLSCCRGINVDPQSTDLPAVLLLCIPTDLIAQLFLARRDELWVHFIHLPGSEMDKHWLRAFSVKFTNSFEPAQTNSRFSHEFFFRWIIDKVSTSFPPYSFNPITSSVIVLLYQAPWKHLLRFV